MVTSEEWFPGSIDTATANSRRKAKLLQEELDSAGADPARLHTILSGHDLLRKHVQEELNVVGGTFGLHDVKSQRFALLQSLEYLHPTFSQLPVIQIPFLLAPARRKQGFERLLEYMFQNRRNQQNFSDNESLPEFYNWLFQPRDSSHLCRVLPWTGMAAEAIASAAYPVGICTAGEMSFCLYAWRWILRHVQCLGSDVPLDSTSPYPHNARTLDLWSLPEWNLSTGPEHDWSEQNPCKRESDPIADSWVNLTKEADGASTDQISALRREWTNLGLLPAGSSPPCEGDERDCPLHRLLNYTDFLVDSTSCTDVDFSMIRELREYKKLVDSAIELKASFAIDDSGITAIDRILRAVILAKLKGAARSTSFDAKPGPSLELLHKISHIPLIPYFYANVLIGKPIDHVVMGVWDSPKFPPPNIQIEGRRNKITTAMFCILLLNPSWRELERSVSNKHSGFDKELDHLDNVRSFFRSLASPLIDAGFYGTLVGEAKKSEEKGAFAHTVAPHIMQLQSPELLEKVPELTRMALWNMLITVQQIWGNWDMKPHHLLEDGMAFGFLREVEGGPGHKFERFVDLSVLIGIQRATKVGGNSNQHSLLRKLKEPELVQRALEVFASEESDPKKKTDAQIANAKGRMNWSIEGEIPAIAFTKGIMLCLHHCVWQAAYHAFESKQLLDYQDSPLRIEVKTNNIRIFNLGEACGLSNGPETKRIPKDGTLYHRLEEKINEDWEKTDDPWIVSITPPAAFQLAEQHSIWLTEVRFQPR